MINKTIIIDNNKEKEIAEFYFRLNAETGNIIKLKGVFYEVMNKMLELDKMIEVLLVKQREK